MPLPLGRPPPLPTPAPKVPKLLSSPQGRVAQADPASDPDWPLAKSVTLLSAASPADKDHARPFRAAQTRPYSAQRPKSKDQKTSASTAATTARCLSSAVSYSLAPGKVNVTPPVATLVPWYCSS